VESGAFFEGNCRHTDNPLADAPEADPPVPKSNRTAATTPRPATASTGGATPPVAPIPKAAGAP
jgi:hypothetical protein